MNPETNREIAETVKKAGHAWLHETPGRVFRAIIHNWPWKLLALFLAVCLWAGLITQDASLTRERVFTDVPLAISGAETLRRNGLIVLSGLEEENLTARLRVEVPQREYNSVTYSNYSPRVDLTRVSKAGQQDVKVTASSTLAYGTVQDVFPATLSVVVDEYVTNYRVPVSVNLIGEYPEGFYGGAFSRDPSALALSGPKSLVDQVARIYVDYDASMLAAEAGDVSTALPMRYVDREGNEIVSDLLEPTSSGVVLRTITVSQTLYPIRELVISEADLISGEPAKGYQVTNVEISPKVLRAAGAEDILNDLESLFTESTASVNGAAESFHTSLRVRRPSEIAYLNTTSIDVAVTVEPVIISSTLSNVRLSVRGTGANVKAATDVRTVSAVVTGPQLVLEALRTADVSAYVDVTGLEDGEYILPVEFHMEDTDAQSLSFEATPASVVVTLTEK